MIAPTASDEPKVLSESAQLAQQISAAIAEHAQQAQATKAEPETGAEENVPAVETSSTTSTEASNDSFAKPTEPQIEVATAVTSGEEKVAPEVIATAEPVITETSVNESATVAVNVEVEALERKTVTEVNLAPPARASNDPRKAPKPVSQVSIITETIESQASRALDTSLPPSVDHNPRPLARPSNDPRLNKRSTNE